MVIYRWRLCICMNHKHKSLTMRMAGVYCSGLTVCMKRIEMYFVFFAKCFYVVFNICLLIVHKHGSQTHNWLKGGNNFSLKHVSYHSCETDDIDDC